MTSKGQVTVPKSVRDALGLRQGDHVAFRIRGDGVVELVPASVDLLSPFGSVKPENRGVTVEQMNETIRDAGAGR